MADNWVIKSEKVQKIMAVTREFESDIQMNEQ